MAPFRVSKPGLKRKAQRAHSSESEYNSDSHTDQKPKHTRTHPSRGPRLNYTQRTIEELDAELNENAEDVEQRSQTRSLQVAQPKHPVPSTKQKEANLAG